MNISKKLEEIVNDVARSGALTPAAIKQFDQMRKDLDEAQAKAERDTREIDNLRKTETILRGTIKEQEIKIREIAAERNDLLNRERAFAEGAIHLQHERDRRQELRSILGDMFRNTVFREEITKTTMMPPRPPSYQGEQVHPTQHLHTDTTKRTQE